MVWFVPMYNKKLNLFKKLNRTVKGRGGLSVWTSKSNAIQKKTSVKMSHDFFRLKKAAAIPEQKQYNSHPNK